MTLKPGKVVEVKCPHCPGKNLYIDHNDGEIRWVCNTCIFVYPRDYFDQMPQFEHLVTRVGDIKKSDFTDTEVEE